VEPNVVCVAHGDQGERKGVDVAAEVAQRWWLVSWWSPRIESEEVSVLEEAVLAGEVIEPWRRDRRATHAWDGLWRGARRRWPTGGIWWAIGVLDASQAAARTLFRVARVAVSSRSA
jgi:hypothetical protein